MVFWLTRCTLKGFGVRGVQYFLAPAIPNNSKLVTISTNQVAILESQAQRDSSMSTINRFGLTCKRFGLSVNMRILVNPIFLEGETQRPVYQPQSKLQTATQLSKPNGSTGAHATRNSIGGELFASTIRFLKGVARGLRMVCCNALGGQTPNTV